MQEGNRYARGWNEVPALMKRGRQKQLLTPSLKEAVSAKRQDHKEMFCDQALERAHISWRFWIGMPTSSAPKMLLCSLVQMILSTS
jgi:hypothetical protein